MNPSTEEILQAFENLPTDKIIILPNNKNIILAAQQTASVTVKKVAVIPCTSVPQGLSAMLRLDPDGNMERVVKEMNEAIKEVETGEITVATRSVELNGVDVQQGQVIALLNGKLVAAAATLEEPAWSCWKKPAPKTANASPCFTANNISRQEVNRIVDLIRYKLPRARDRTARRRPAALPVHYLDRVAHFMSSICILTDSSAQFPQLGFRGAEHVRVIPFDIELNGPCTKKARICAQTTCPSAPAKRCTRAWLLLPSQNFKSCT